MASITMTAPFLSGSTAITIATKQPSSIVVHRRGVVMAKAWSKDMLNVSEKRVVAKEQSGRRDLVFGVAAAAAWAVAKVAMADEPKRGSMEAKEKYAPICVTMPTARICRN